MKENNFDAPPRVFIYGIRIRVNAAWWKTKTINVNTLRQSRGQWDDGVIRRTKKFPQWQKKSSITDDFVSSAAWRWSGGENIRIYNDDDSYMITIYDKTNKSHRNLNWNRLYGSMCVERTSYKKPGGFRQRRSCRVSVEEPQKLFTETSALKKQTLSLDGQVAWV